ncbi:MAG: tetratricopeptide repeat protein [Syntrophomonadaceae bacterium]|jgi:tetratricopeptide (TPR) repeat protein|nr:tetratricopeptide repeat protein [Bacillota bacterium]NLM87256.1 tetratricopeptide repeat protein [Syntrophomonadaceae bacterium]HAA08163.1 hypothetical protein [Syntrophomonas sp.]HQA50427.1 tetratricopeptide repeat protein [Syntrophomonadaceae bacterium]HQD91332.1 tetratricopeptide repeat protein [Syntrophomonadaceae bacterium]
MKSLDASQVDDLLTSAAARIQQHDISGALDMLVEAYKTCPDNNLILNMTGRCYQILGEFERAERCWEESLAIEPDNSVALTNLKEMRQPAFRFWVKRYNEALTMLEKKKFSEARLLLRQLMEEHDEYVSLYKVLGLCCLAEGDRLEAHHIWKKGLEIDRNNRSLQEYLSLPERRVKPLNKVQETPKETKTIFTSRTLLLITGILCLVLVIQTVALFNSYRQNNENIEVLQQRIHQLTALVDGQPKEEIETMSISPDIEEPSMEGTHYDVEQEEHYYLAGYNAHLSKDWKTAESNLGVVVSMQSGSYLNREALYYLARTYYVQNKYEEAEKYYQLYLDLFPDSNYYDDSLFYLACTYHYTGRHQQAQEVLQQLKELDPANGYLSSELYKTIVNQ